MIAVLTPTRGKPDLALRMLESAKDTADEPDRVRMLFGIDHDETEDYSVLNKQGLCVRMGEAENTVGKVWNFLVGLAPDAAQLMMGNDDLVYCTQGWDTALKERVQKYQDGIYVAWFDDGSPASSYRCAFPIVSMKWCTTLGYFMPICFNFLWHDTWVWHIGRELGRELYIPDVLVEHRHFSFQKAEYDATYRRHRIGREARDKRKADEVLFGEMEEVRHRHAMQLKAVMHNV